MSKEAIKLALEALEDANNFIIEVEGEDAYRHAITALEEALAKQEGQSNFCPNCEALGRELKAIKQEQGEPVAWLDEEKKIIYWHNTHETDDYHGFKRTTPLYTTPQQRKPLTDKVLNIIASQWHMNLLAEKDKADVMSFARAIEAAHGIKE